MIHKRLWEVTFFFRGKMYLQRISNTWPGSAAQEALRCLPAGSVPERMWVQGFGGFNDSVKNEN